MVERDLPKVDVEGSKPFSRSKKQKDQVKDLVFCFWREGFLRTLEEGSTKFFCGRKPVKRI